MVDDAMKDEVKTFALDGRLKTKIRTLISS